MVVVAAAVVVAVVVEVVVGTGPSPLLAPGTAHVLTGAGATT